MSLVKFNMTIVTDVKGGVSKNNVLPWINKPEYRSELLYITDLTIKPNEPSEIGVVIMGRKTWDSLPKENKPLSGRFNIVLTRNSTKFETDNPTFKDHPYLRVESSLDNALGYLNNKRGIGVPWLIGGVGLHKEALSHPQLNSIYHVLLPDDFECDQTIDLSKENLVATGSPSLLSDIHVSNGARIVKYYKAKPENIIGYIRSL